MSENCPIHEKILENNNLTIKLFSFLDTDRLMPILAGYFTKVVLPLINRNPDKAFRFIFESQVDSKLVKHVYSKSIVEIIVKILTFDAGSPEFFLQERRNLVQLLISSLATAADYNVQFAGSILSDICSKSPEIQPCKELIDVIINAENLKLYFDCISYDDTFKPIAGTNLLKNIINLSLKPEFSNLFEKVDLPLIAIENLEKIQEKLATPSKICIKGSFGEDIYTLGETRLRLIELVTILLKIDNSTLYEKIAESKVFDEIIKLFFELPWNSMLHNAVDCLVLGAINTRSDVLINSILISSNLLEKIVTTGLGTQTRHRLGIMGYITKISNFLKNSENDAVIECLRKTQRLEEFNKIYLESRNTFESKQLGEANKNFESSSESEQPETELQFHENPKNIPVHHENTETNQSEDKNQETEEKNLDKEESQPEHTAKQPGSPEKPHHFFENAENVIEEETKKEYAVETHIEPDHTPHVPHNIISPKSKGHLNLSHSPEINSEFNQTNFWAILKVDEIDLLEEL
jgi:SIT4 phosphatase-associated protein